MPIDEIFPYPTVKQVIFQVRFPNLFYIESKVGDLQMRIMREFPESRLAYRRSIFVADVGPDVKLTDIPSEGSETARKIWQFKSEYGVQLNVLSDSLDISSEHHKTYDHPGSDKFRDVVELVLSSFLETTSIPVFSRIGLRYIDDCPIPSVDDEAFRSYYSSVFPLERFSLVDTNEMSFATVVRRGPYQLRYAETLQLGERPKFILDFDGFAARINSADYLRVTDDLHTLILAEYEQTIREPLKEYMRHPKEG